MRKITIFNSKTGSTNPNYTTSANTWEELANELSNAGVYTPDLIAICKETKTEFTEHSELPRAAGLNDVDFTLFLVPTKNKAGL